MKLLKIEDNQGHFLAEDRTFTPIDRITKENLLNLVSLTLTEEVEFDDYDNEAIKNQAHQILYRSIYDKLRGLRDRRKEFTDDSERLYLQEYEKYREDSSQPGSEDAAENRATSLNR